MDPGAGSGSSGVGRAVRGAVTLALVGLLAWWLTRAPASRSFQGMPPMPTGARTPEVNRALILLRDGTVPEQRLRGIAQLRMIAAQRRLRPAAAGSEAARAHLAEAESVTLVLAAHAATEQRKLWVRTAAVYAIGDWHPLCTRDHTVLLQRGAKNDGLPPTLKRAYESVVDLEESE